MEIDFIERVNPMDDIRDALLSSRMAFNRMMSSHDAVGDQEIANAISYIYPKLRFAWLSMQRYEFAMRFLRDRDFVLDVPCGTGYGTAILGSNGNVVLGMDIDEASIALASDRYMYQNVRFATGDMMTVELPTGVGFITCLDGLEHVRDGRHLIERFVASLTDDGILVVSVPINELEITKGRRNPFHLAEYTPESLRELLSKYFRRVSLFGHDLSGAISGIDNAFDGITAVCEV